MTALSAETRRLLQLSRRGDDPTPVRENAVRSRLVARLGVTALAGVAAGSAAGGAAEASTAVGTAMAKAASAGATTTALAKTVATVVLAVGLGAGAWKSDGVLEQVIEWPVAAAAQAKRVANRAWRIVTGAESPDGKPRRNDRPEPPISSERLHQRLIVIARRPNHPVAKGAELLWILRAEQALAEGDAERAAHDLDQHEARFATGELSDDREALRMQIESARNARPAPSVVAPPSQAVPTNF